MRAALLDVELDLSEAPAVERPRDLVEAPFRTDHRLTWTPSSAIAGVVAHTGSR